jgi:hypothetical protein
VRRNLYQIYSYVQNVRSSAVPMDGMLLYAQTGRPLNERFMVNGSMVTIKTVDLSADWQTIRQDLLHLEFD